MARIPLYHIKTPQKNNKIVVQTKLLDIEKRWRSSPP